MSLLVAAVVLIGGISIVNLLLTLAVIRRLRDPAATGAGRAAPPDLPELPAGSPVPAFQGQTVSGQTVSAQTTAGSAAVFAFFDTGCSSCKPAVPKLVNFAKKHALPAGQVIAVVGDNDGNAAEYIDALGDTATVIVEETMGNMARAFSLDSFPAFVIADADGVIVRSGHGGTTLAAGLPA
ncbi:TlpA family protein disulfide reductase [Streptosporangium sp. NPDC000396]|uniref:TlpA family protein disulfide reductase n=1 Tax=Streptosporangium sp. NPDC000396 TaxID=3366185 RepID=UPI003673E060